jgi:hypothetical protein
VRKFFISVCFYLFHGVSFLLVCYL